MSHLLKKQQLEIARRNMQSPTDSKTLAVTVKQDLQRVGRAYDVSQLILDKLELCLANVQHTEDGEALRDLRTAAAVLKDAVGSMVALRAEARETIAAAKATPATSATPASAVPPVIAVTPEE